MVAGLQRRRRLWLAHGGLLYCYPKEEPNRFKIQYKKLHWVLVSFTGPSEDL